MGGVPETRYARYGDVHFAYQVLGDGPDLLFVPLASFPIDLIWDEPASRARSAAWRRSAV